MSVNDTNTEIAFEILSGQEIFPEGLLTEVFVVYKLTDNEVLKEKAMAFLKHYNIDETSSIIRAKSHLKTANGATEKRIKTNISTYVSASKGKLDGVKMATAMFNKYGVGLHYLLENAEKQQQHKLLETFMNGSAFKMTGVSLTKIPEALYDFENLTEIDFSVNDLTTLPVKIKEFKKLQRLNIRENKVKKLPKSITTLKKLTHLNISNNRISEFPVEIAKMSQLIHLDVNQMKKRTSHHFTIPENFKYLSNIKELTLSSYNAYPDNLITNYTNYPTLSSLSSDTPLDLNPLKLAEHAYLTNGKHDGVSYLFEHSDNSELKHKIIAEQFYDATQKSLNFKEVQLHNFPDEVGDFEVNNINCSEMSFGMDKNNFSDNHEENLYTESQIDELCKGLITLKNIEEADFSENNLKFVPSQLLTWKNLKKMDLSKNELGGGISFFGNDEKEDPNFLINKDLSNWSELEELNLERNKILQLPESFSSLKNLKKLNLESNSLNDLPSNINKLISLEELNLKRNYIESLPIELCELSNLTNLEIDIKKMEVLEVLSKLKNLKNLKIKISNYRDISKNDCEYIAKKIGQLSNLKNISFEDTQRCSFDERAKIAEMYKKEFQKCLPISCELTLKNW